MEPTILYSTLFGSHLYGTNTPTSDLDYKRVVLPHIDHLLLGKPVVNKVSKTNTAKNVRNTVDDIDREDIPLQVFIQDFVNGQTYAIELAFSIDGSHAQQDVSNGRFKILVHELRSRFLTSNVKAMMGYVFNQANIYSFKGERLNAARELYDLLLLGYCDASAGDDPISDFVDRAKPMLMSDGVTLYKNGIIFRDEFAKLAKKFPRVFRIDQYDIGNEKTAPCFVILEKVLPWTNTLAHSLKVVTTIINKYGARADASSAANVDWKAMMHAVRIVDEGIELLAHGAITLPRPLEQAERLLKIKRGELPLEPLKSELVSKLEALKDSSTSSTLPTSQDQQFRIDLEEFTLRWLHEFYFT